MDYRLELLDEDTFENLVNTICQEILGTGVVTFSPGKDGGKDGRFNGKAQNYPSKTDYWNGKFVIQSKHTSIPNASCSDSDFETLVEKEIKKVKELKSKREIDNYLLFTNRKYTGIKGDALLNKIIDETGLSNVSIIGKEVINNQYLNPNKSIVRLYRLDKHHIPFDFSDEEIKEIIIAFKSHLKAVVPNIKTKVDELKYDYTHIDKDQKNEKNQLGNSYYRNEILSKSLAEFDKIEMFLENPRNADLKDYYYDTANELNQIITINRNNFDAFEELFVFIYTLVCDGSTELKGAKRHVTTFLHYMYVECLIGIK